MHILMDGAWGMVDALLADYSNIGESAASILLSYLENTCDCRKFRGVSVNSVYFRFVLWVLSGLRRDFEFGLL